MSSVSNKSPALEHSLVPRVLNALLVAAVGVVGLWLVSGMAGLFWLAEAAPLTEADLRDVSWLGSPTTALHFTTGFMGAFLIVTIMWASTGISVIQRSPLPLVLGLVASIVLHFGGSEQAAVRVGLLDGTVRLGCFVPETKECREMLAMDSTGYRSRYESDKSNAEWYIVRRAEESRASALSVNMSSIPVTALLKAPFYASRANELREVLATQRAELIRMRVANAP